MLYVKMFFDENRERDNLAVLPGEVMAANGREVPNFKLKLGNFSKVPYQGDNDGEFFLKSREEFVMEEQAIVALPSKNHRQCPVNGTLIVSDSPIVVIGVPVIKGAAAGQNLSGQNLAVNLGKNGGYYFSIIFAKKFYIAVKGEQYRVESQVMRCYAI